MNPAARNAVDLRRLWFESENAAALNDEGFLRDETRPPSGYLATDELPESRHLVLLGPEGAGKTVEMKRLATHLGPSALMIEAALAQPPWESRLPHLIVDGLDEVALDRQLGLLQGVASHVRTSNGRLVITCRESHWTERHRAVLTQSLDSEPFVLRLAPLTHSHAVRLLRIDDRNLPVSDLLVEFHVPRWPRQIEIIRIALSTGLPASGDFDTVLLGVIRQWCAETDENRVSLADADERLAVAGALAVRSVLEDKPVLSWRPTDSAAPELRVGSVSGSVVHRLTTTRAGPDAAPASTLPARAETVTALANCSLFRSIEGGRRVWEHRTTAEFLAAVTLLARNLTAMQLRDLLCEPRSETTIEVSAPFRSVAARCLSLDPCRSVHLVLASPSITTNAILTAVAAWISHERHASGGRAGRWLELVGSGEATQVAKNCACPTPIRCLALVLATMSGNEIGELARARPELRFVEHLLSQRLQAEHSDMAPQLPSDASSLSEWARAVCIPKDGIVAAETAAGDIHGGAAAAFAPSPQYLWADNHGLTREQRRQELHRQVAGLIGGSDTVTAESMLGFAFEVYDGELSGAECIARELTPEQHEPVLSTVLTYLADSEAEFTRWHSTNRSDGSGSAEQPDGLMPFEALLLVELLCPHRLPEAIAQCPRSTLHYTLVDELSEEEEDRWRRWRDIALNIMHARLPDIFAGEVAGLPEQVSERGRFMVSGSPIDVAAASWEAADYPERAAMVELLSRPVYARKRASLLSMLVADDRDPEIPGEELANATQSRAGDAALAALALEDLKAALSAEDAPQVELLLVPLLAKRSFWRTGLPRQCCKASAAAVIRALTRRDELGSVVAAAGAEGSECLWNWLRSRPTPVSDDALELSGEFPNILAFGSTWSSYDKRIPLGPRELSWRLEAALEDRLDLRLTPYRELDAAWANARAGGFGQRFRQDRQRDPWRSRSAEKVMSLLEGSRGMPSPASGPSLQQEVVALIRSWEAELQGETPLVTFLWSEPGDGAVPLPEPRLSDLLAWYLRLRTRNSGIAVIRESEVSRVAHSGVGERPDIRVSRDGHGEEVLLELKVLKGRLSGDAPDVGRLARQMRTQLQQRYVDRVRGATGILCVAYRVGPGGPAQEELLNQLESNLQEEALAIARKVTASPIAVVVVDAAHLRARRDGSCGVDAVVSG